MTMPRVGLASRDSARDGRGDVRIIDRVGRVRAQVRDSESPAAQVRNERLLQRDARVVAADRDAADVGHRRQVGKGWRSTRPAGITVTRRAASVSLASGVTMPASRELDGRADVQHPRIRLGDDVEALHSPSSTAMCARLRYFSA